MIYHQLFGGLKSQRIVKAGVIGVGSFAKSVITKSKSIKRLDIPIVADIDVAAAKKAFYGAGFTDADIEVCSSAKAAQKALEANKRVIVEDPMLMMGLPIDVIVESTGVYDHAVQHVLAAIKNGKHVAMVSKEADCTVGPMLKKKANQAGVVFSAVDGDQPGLLMGLIGWATELGLDIVSCGKSLDGECVMNETRDGMTFYSSKIELGTNGAEVFSPMSRPDQGRAIVDARRAIAGKRARVSGFDIAELILVANSCKGLQPECDAMVSPILRIPEIPHVLCPESEGGILRRGSVIDAVTVLRRHDEMGLGGGVFIVVNAPDKGSRDLLSHCVPHNDSQTAFLIVRPYHLLGVEATMTMMCAGLLGTPTGALEYEQRWDLVGRANKPLKAGYKITHHKDDHGGNFDFEIRASQPLQDKSPIPFYLAMDTGLSRDVASGEVLTLDAVIPNRSSALWSLRAEQDAYTFIKHSGAG
jgi:predicted homoserine dehydrogenase-like protein